ncbi:MAG: DUF362 domain-containing protein [Armatimonadetes bacterium]|nr:DUF362 domain-containing protein [Armatimonadota bacterium]
MKRRDLLRWAGLSGAALLAGCQGKATTTGAGAGAGEEGAARPAPDPSKAPGAASSASGPKAAAGKRILAVASKGEPEAQVLAVVGALGGIERFVRSGSLVVIKPNIGWARGPEVAANTNPQVVAAVVGLCKKAGAGRVLVVEHPCDEPAQVCFEMSGIEKAVKAAGGEIVAASQEAMYRELSIPAGKSLKSAQVIREIPEADCFINLPVAKDHSATRLSLGMKNLMGAVWNRQEWHDADLSQCIADYTSAVTPHLTIIDATRILVGSGPKGPGPTKDTRQIVASADPVAADAYAATLFNLKPSDVPYIARARDLGLGEMNLDTLEIARV